MVLEIDVLDADRIRRTTKTIGALMKIAGQVTYTKRTVTLDGTSQQLVAPNAALCGVIIVNREGNSRIEFDPEGGALEAGEGWPIWGGDRPVCFLGAAAPIGGVTVIGTTGNVVTVWELT